MCQAVSSQSGVRWALSHTANDFYYDDKNLLPQEQQTLKRIFLQLLQPSVSSEVKSNRLKRKALYQEREDKEQTNRIINKLSEENQLLLRGKQIDQAHQLIKYAEASQVKYVETSKSPTILEKEFVQKSLQRRKINRVKWTLGSLAIFGLIIGLPAFVYYADLQKQHAFIIQQLGNRLENKEAELKIANESRKNAENLLESNRQSIQQMQDIRRNAEQLLQEAKTTQKNVNTQLEIAKKISQEAEDARKDANAKSDNFGWGIGKSRAEVCLLLGCVDLTLSKWMEKYIKKGLEGLVEPIKHQDIG